MLTGLNPISIVTELRLQHARGNKYAGVNVRKVAIDHRCARCHAPSVWLRSFSCSALQCLLLSTACIECPVESDDRPTSSLSANVVSSVNVIVPCPAGNNQQHARRECCPAAPGLLFGAQVAPIRARGVRSVPESSDGLCAASPRSACG